MQLEPKVRDWRKTGCRALCPHVAAAGAAALYRSSIHQHCWRRTMHTHTPKPALPSLLSIQSSNRRGWTGVSDRSAADSPEQLRWQLPHAGTMRGSPSSSSLVPWVPAASRCGSLMTVHSGPFPVKGRRDSHVLAPRCTADMACAFLGTDPASTPNPLGTAPQRQIPLPTPIRRHSRTKLQQPESSSPPQQAPVPPVRPQWSPSLHSRSACWLWSACR